MQVIYNALCLPDLVIHVASAVSTLNRCLLTTGVKSDNVQILAGETNVNQLRVQFLKSAYIYTIAARISSPNLVQVSLRVKSDSLV